MADSDACFYRLDEFATPLIWNGSVTVNCIFTDNYISVDLGDGPPVSSREPEAIVHDTDLPSVAVGDAVRVNGEDFTVRDIQADGAGTGDSLLVLSV